MSEKQLTPVDRRIEKALAMRAEGRSWRYCARVLGVDSSNLIKHLKAHRRRAS